MSAWEVVIGLEVHAQLLTKTKIFCFVENKYGEKENSQVGPVSAGLPGALPVLNKKAVELGVRAGIGLNCKINLNSEFSRKNYFYPDSPKGYQITQFDQPICGNGFVDVRLSNGKTKRIGVTRIHLEDDAGKSTHFASATTVNLNRSGVPLAEIVSEADMRGPEEAVAYLKKVHAILVYADVCDGNLEEGNFRCDVNLSVRPVGQKEFGTRCELKNINSFRFVEKAIEYEMTRQIAVIESGGKIIQETRGWDSAAGKTYSMRSKEDAQDYRYFPEPDLPPLKLTQNYVDQIRSQMPELPDAKKQRFVFTFSLPEYDAEILTSDNPLADYFEQVVAAGAPAKQASNWIMGELLRELKATEGDITKSPIKPTQLVKLISLVETGRISGKIAKDVFSEMFATGADPESIVQAKGLIQISDEKTIQSWIDQVFSANPEQVAGYKAGKTKFFGFFVGEVMKISGGKANPPLVSKLITKKLTEPS